MDGIHVRSVGRPVSTARCRVLVGVLSIAVLILPGVHGSALANEDEMQYALILDDEGVVINVAVFHPVDSAGWLEAMQQKGAHVVVREQNTVGIGSVLQPDGSFARDVPPPPPAAPEPPVELPGAEDGTQAWNQHGVPPEPEPEPRKPVFKDPELAKFLGVAPRPERGSAPGTGRIKTALIVRDGVVVNAAVYHTVDSVGWLDLMRRNGATVIIVPEHSAGIGWLVREDGSIVPPPPRPGLVWNGTEWRAPGTEDVVRPGDVRGWSTGATERIPDGQRTPSSDPLEDVADATGPVARITDEFAGVHGLVIVPEEALVADPTTAEIAERSIVMLESYGDTVPFLARFDGLTQLRERLEHELDAAIMAREQATGEPVEEEVAEGFRGAARRLAASFLSLFGMDTTAWIRGIA